MNNHSKFIGLRLKYKTLHFLIHSVMRSAFFFRLFCRLFLADAQRFSTMASAEFQSTYLSVLH